MLYLSLPYFYCVPFLPEFLQCVRYCLQRSPAGADKRGSVPDGLCQADVGGQFAEGCGRLGEIVGGHPGSDLGIFVRGGDDEVAVVDDDRDGAVRSFHFMFSGWGRWWRGWYVTGIARLTQIRWVGPN